MKEIKLDCNPKYTIREDGVVISYMYNKPRVMKTYKNKHGADIVDIRVNGKYKHVHIKTLIEQYFPEPIPDGFKPIPGYGDRFYANLKGEILSESAYSANNKGRRILKQSNNKGYKTVTINNKTEYVHRLIAITFIPNPNNLPCINHKDEDKSNNNVSNLEWCNYEYNSNYNCLGIRKALHNAKHIVVTNVVTGNKTIYRNKNHCSCELGFAVATITKHIKDKTIYKNYMFEYERTR